MHRCKRWVGAIVIAAATVAACGSHESARGSTDATSTSVKRRATTTTVGTAAPSITTALPPSSTSPPQTTPPTPSSTIPPDPACAVGSVRQRLAQLLFVGLDPVDTTTAQALLSRPEPPGGLFVGGNPTSVFRDLPQLTERYRPIVAVDEEGGRVQRVDTLRGPLPSAQEQAQWTPEKLRSEIEKRGRQLAELGVTMDFAPVVDLDSPGPGRVIGDRSFGTDPTEVVQDARVFTEGLLAGGVIPTLKHFPGHGRAEGDTHKVSTSTPPWSDLLERDLVPFRELAGGRRDIAVMTAHVQVPGLTGELPASLARATYQELRKLGFDGLAITDELSMQAVSSTHKLPVAVATALEAGADMALFNGPSMLPAVLDYLEKNRIRYGLTDERIDTSLQRVLRLRGCPHHSPVDE